MGFLSSWTQEGHPEVSIILKWKVNHFARATNIYHKKCTKGQLSYYNKVTKL
jgi:hypothetical protein